MLDLKKIRTNPDEIKKALKNIIIKSKIVLLKEEGYFLFLVEV